jgi:putative spermidine/putrescine transport system permease protein
MSLAGRHAIATALLLLPALVLLGGWFLAPLARLFQFSLAHPAGPFAAYAELLGNEVYRDIFGRTLRLAAEVTAISLLLAYPAANLLSRLRGAAFTIALYCVLFPFWISVLVRTFSWILLLERNGPVNALLTQAGLVSQPVSFLFNHTGVMIGMLHVLLPYALLPIYAAMVKVDRRLLLASEGLGASPLTTFWRVYLPLTLPGVLAGAAFVFLLALGFFITPALLGGIQNVTAAMLIDNFVSERLVWPLAAAASFVLLAIVLVLMALAGRFVYLGQLLVTR